MRLRKAASRERQEDPQTLAGIKVEDNPSEGVYPLPVYTTGKDECFVGRIREDLSTENGIALWSVLDNVRKGTAINAVQIAEHLISMRR